MYQFVTNIKKTHFWVPFYQKKHKQIFHKTLVSVVNLHVAVTSCKKQNFCVLNLQWKMQYKATSFLFFGLQIFYLKSNVGGQKKSPFQQFFFLIQDF